ncbi:MAG: hypothetical protein VYE22_09820 [Myxococcota bacterium]|nr:hypothetical protein [Myxococcota bacterium]
MTDTIPTGIDDDLRGVLERLGERICSDAELEAYEAAEAVAARRRLMEASGIVDVLPPEDVEALALNSYRDGRAIDLVTQFVAQTQLSVGRPILVLMGGTGLGKTVAAGWALARTPGIFIEAGDLVRAQIAADGRSPRSPDVERWRRLTRTGLLVVDELGTNRDVDDAQVAFREIINRRQDRRRPTILLGNIEPKVFWSRFDSRTRDRLRVCAFVRGLTGDSMRAPRRRDADAR